MASKLPKPIKQPKQSRSRAVYRSIIEACYRVLPQYGEKKTTTNKIADTAGVSIGSLYQYFPNKEAIYSTAIEHLMNDNVQKFLALLDNPDQLEPEAFVEQLIDQGLDIFLGREELFRALFRIGPRIRGMRDLYAIHVKIVDAIAKSFEATYSDVDPAVIRQVSHVLLEAFHGNVQAYMVGDPMISKDDLRTQIKRLALSYIRYSLALERGEQAQPAPA